MTYLYNGVALTDIHTVWNGECAGVAMPYALIMKNSYGNYQLYVTTKELVHIGNELVAELVKYGKFVYDDNLPPTWGNPTVADVPTLLSVLVDKYIWSNYDILNEDGSVYLAASEPVPVLSMNYKLAFVLGSIPLGTVGREPVAYLYNGVRLPGLPELPYQYAMICCEGDPATAKNWWLDVTSTPYFTDAEKGPRSYGPYERWWSYNGGAWEFIDSFEQDENEMPYNFNPFWANYDYIDKYDNSVVLAASEPIPIYE